MGKWTNKCDELMLESPKQLRQWDDKCELISRVFNNDPRFQYVMVNPVTAYCPLVNCRHREYIFLFNVSCAHDEQGTRRWEH